MKPRANGLQAVQRLDARHSPQCLPIADRAGHRNHSEENGIASLHATKPESPPNHATTGLAVYCSDGVQHRLRLVHATGKPSWSESWKAIDSHKPPVEQFLMREVPCYRQIFVPRGRRSHRFAVLLRDPAARD